MDEYNDTIQSFPKTKPSETFTKLKYEKEINVKKPKFKVGDIVRIYTEGGNLILKKVILNNGHMSFLKSLMY